MEQTEKIKFIVYTTIFGCVWGLSEMLIGSWLHMVQFPLRGAVMASLGAVILCAGRKYSDRPGSAIASGFVAVIIKLMSAGAFKLGPVAGILIESVMIELILVFFGCGRMQFFLACVAASLEAIPHFFVTNWIFYGRGIFETYLAIVRQVQGIFGISGDFWLWILALWAGAHVMTGIAAGIIAARFAEKK